MEPDGASTRRVPRAFPLGAATGLTAFALLAAGAQGAAAASAPSAGSSAGQAAARHAARPHSRLHPVTVPASGIDLDRFWEQLRQGPGTAAGPGSAPLQESTNWAGYAVTGGTFTTVSSSWVEPAVSCSTTGMVAFWLGLDGWGSGSVEQDGTGVDCSSRAPRHFAWWETYPANAIQDYPDPVAVGDHLTSSVSFLGNGAYELVLQDVSKGWTERNRVSSPGAANASAEIIAEAVTSDNIVTSLPDFGSIGFTGSKIDRASLFSAGAAPIDMTGTAGSVLASTGSLDAGGDFTVTYQGGLVPFADFVAGKAPKPAGTPQRR